LSAFRGIKHALHERNFVIQVGIGLAAVSLAFGLKLNFEEKTIIIILTALVWVIEIVNTAFERLLNEVIKERNVRVARIKELMAAAVFIFSAAAFFLGLWIFGRLAWEIMI
jgi:diacylglycerol kinase